MLGCKAFGQKLHLIAVVSLVLALAPLITLAEPPPSDPVDVLRRAVLQRDYGRWWDVLADDSRKGRNRKEFIRYRRKATAYALHFLEKRHGVPFSVRVRDFCTWSGMDRQNFQGRYRMEFRSRVHLGGKSWAYVTTCYFKLRVVGDKVSLTYTRFWTWFDLVTPRVIL